MAHRPLTRFDFNAMLAAPFVNDELVDEFTRVRIQHALDATFLPGAYTATLHCDGDPHDPDSYQCVDVHRSRGPATAAWYQLRRKGPTFDLVRVPELTVETLLHGQEEEVVASAESIEEVVEAMRKRLRARKRRKSVNPREAPAL